ncbi:MAG: D-alanine--D-alanine ligase [Ruminococcus sp.]|jgi:D-alanine-D-alanine ligase|nr:D-alanine--D-alanine ligase [Ruminococcus sp.]
MAKIKVAVLFGGASNEHDISLISASNVISSIPKDKYDVTCIGITKKGRWLYYPGDVEDIKNGKWEFNTDCTSAVISPDPINGGILIIENGEVSVRKIDVVFPVLHGKNGEDGTLQGLLDMAKIPYVGCGLLASACCMDKAHTHMILDYNGIKTAKWKMITQGNISHLEKEYESIAQKLKFPLFVKPANCGSSIGINKANNLEELDAAVKTAFSHDSKVIIEEFIKGRELEVAVFGYDSPFASYVGEIQACNEFYDYDAKYVLGDSRLSIPAELEADKMNEIRNTALKAYKALGCRGLSRVDFFLTDDGTVYINEINTMPGFTPISMYPKLMEDLGMSQSYLVDKLIEQAIEKAY